MLLMRVMVACKVSDDSHRSQDSAVMPRRPPPATSAQASSIIHFSAPAQSSSCSNCRSESWQTGCGLKGAARQASPRPLTSADRQGGSGARHLQEREARRPSAEPPRSPRRRRRPADRRRRCCRPLASPPACAPPGSMSASQVHLVADASRRSTSSGGSARAAPELDAARGGLGAGGKAQRKDTPTLQVRQRPRLASGATLQWQQLTALCRKNLTIRCAGEGGD